MELLNEKLVHTSRKELLPFTYQTFNAYQANWHHRVLCKYLEMLECGAIKRLIVAMPPRTGKSELVSRRFPAWALGKNPNREVVIASYSSDLADSMNTDVQKIMESEEFKKVFPEARLVEKGIKDVEGRPRRTQSYCELVNKHGTLKSVGVGGSLTGFGIDIGIIDDPHKDAAEADSMVFRDKVWNWFQSVIQTRLEPGAALLVNQTRWHEDDLVGRIKVQIKSGDPDFQDWVVLEFPAIKEVHQPNSPDPRHIGEPLWPDKYDLGYLMKLRKTIGTRWFRALYQQDPTVEQGNMIKEEWFRYYDEPPSSFDKILASWDLNFSQVKASEKADYVVGTIWGTKGPQRYLLREYRGQWNFVDQISMIQEALKDFPQTDEVLIENRANGIAAIQILEDKISRITKFDPDRSKESRLAAVSPQFEAGNVYFPNPETNPWVEDFKDELKRFPRAPNDDRCDSVSQALIKLRDGDGFFDLLVVNH